MQYRHYEIIIYDGPHYCDPILCKYFAIGSREQLIAGAEVKIMQKQQQSKNPSKRHWVDVVEGINPVTHYNLDLS